MRLWLLLCGVLLLVSNLSAAFTSAIADCDETFNYWEPLHFITFGRGFQTWEYSPEYALRSYLYLLPHAGVAHFWALLVGRPAAFFATRATQAVIATACELSLVLASFKKFGRGVAINLAVLLGSSPGMWVAGVAFLPSSTATLLVSLIWSLWMQDQPKWAIFFGSAAVVVVWPFTGLLFIPLGIHSLYLAGPVKALASAIASFSLWALLSLGVDSKFYGRLVLPSLEILKYNVLSKGSSGSGSELYGTEPWYFYFLNGALNLTITLPASLALLPVACCLRFLEQFRSGEKDHADLTARSAFAAAGFSLAGYMWLAFFSCIPHKEERFLAPAYPVLALAAAVALRSVAVIISRIFGSRLLGAALETLAVVAAVGLSLSRILTLYVAYAAPLQIYSALSKELLEVRQAQRAPGTWPINVCIGSEWHRFSTSFFLPHEEDHIVYVRHGPVGLLPAAWDSAIGTSGVPLHMNDRNEEEPSRYVEWSTCDYFIDLDLGGESQGDTAMLRRQEWTVIAEAEFLDAARSPQPWRSFFIPYISRAKNTFAPYRLLRRKRVE